MWQNTPNPVPMDFDGDGRTDITVWRPSTGTWYTLNSSNGFDPDLHQWRQWGEGAQGDIPVPGDYDGDWEMDVAVWRPSTATWYIKQFSDNVVRAVQWGDPTDIPVPGHYDNDAITDVAVWRPATATWYIKQSSDNAVKAVQWGDPTDIPTPGDYDGDLKTDIAVRRPSAGVWYILQSTDGYDQAKYKWFQWGDPTDIPIPGS